MSETIKATKAPGMRRILFSNLPAHPEEYERPEEMEISVSYIGESNAYNGACLDGVVLPHIVKACNDYAGLVEVIKGAAMAIHEYIGGEWEPNVHDWTALMENLDKSIN